MLESQYGACEDESDDILALILYFSSGEFAVAYYGANIAM